VAPGRCVRGSLSGTGDREQGNSNDEPLERSWFTSRADWLSFEVRRSAVASPLEPLPAARGTGNRETRTTNRLNGAGSPVAPIGRPSRFVVRALLLGSRSCLPPGDREQGNSAPPGRSWFTSRADWPSFEVRRSRFATPLAQPPAAVLRGCTRSPSGSRCRPGGLGRPRASGEDNGCTAADSAFRRRTGFPRPAR